MHTESYSIQPPKRQGANKGDYLTNSCSGPSNCTSVCLPDSHYHTSVGLPDSHTNSRSGPHNCASVCLTDCPYHTGVTTDRPRTGRFD